MKQDKRNHAGAPDDPENEKGNSEKAYENYSSQFTPKPRYFMNAARAFMSGGSICAASLWLEEYFIGWGFSDKTAAVCVVMILIMAAQLLTGLGLFDSIAKFAGAGVVVPITGFANSMVAPAIEYKKEGIVLGVGAKLFSLAGAGAGMRHYFIYGDWDRVLDHGVVLERIPEA